LRYGGLARFFSPFKVFFLFCPESPHERSKIAAVLSYASKFAPLSSLLPFFPEKCACRLYVSPRRLGLPVNFFKLQFFPWTPDGLWTFFTFDVGGEKGVITSLYRPSVIDVRSFFYSFLFYVFFFFFV